MRRRRSEVCLRQREASVFLIRRDFFHATLRFHHEHPSGKLHSGAFQRSHNVSLDLPNRLLGEVPVDLKHDARGYASSAKRLKSNPGAPTGSRSDVNKTLRSGFGANAASANSGWMQRGSGARWSPIHGSLCGGASPHCKSIAGILFWLRQTTGSPNCVGSKPLPVIDVKIDMVGTTPDPSSRAGCASVGDHNDERYSGSSVGPHGPADQHLAQGAGRGSSY